MMAMGESDIPWEKIKFDLFYFLAFNIFFVSMNIHQSVPWFEFE